MTRKELIKALRCFACEENCPADACNEKFPYWIENDKFNLDDWDAEISDEYQLCRAAADMLEQDAKTGWISVKDRLPSRGGRYLVAVGNDFDDVCIAEYDGKEFGETVPEYDGLGHVFEDWDAIKFATHWTEMPEPPKEDEE